MNEHHAGEERLSGQTGLGRTNRSGNNRVFTLALKTTSQIVRHWWAFAAAFAVSLIGGIYLSSRIATTTYKSNAALIYHPLPVDDAADHLYVPPDLKTMMSLINSGGVLQNAISAVRADTTPIEIAEDLTIDEPRNTRRIGLTLAADDPDEGRDLLNAICKAFQQVVSEMRKETVARTLEDVRASLVRSENRMKVAREELMSFTGRLELSDIEAELKQLATELSAMEFKLNTYEVEEQGLRVQHRIVQQQLTDQKREEALQTASEKEAEAAEESLADNRRRQDRLNELIREERRLNEIRSRLDARQNEFDRKLRLFEKGYISRADFEAIEADVKSLQSQIMEGKKIEEWKNELTRIDKMVVPKAKTRRIGSPIIHQTMFKLVELDLQINNAQEVQRQIALKLAGLRQRIQDLRLFEQQQAGLVLEIRAADDEHNTLSRQLSALTAIYEMGPLEFVVAEPPSDVMQVPYSNRKKVFAVVFIVLAVLLHGPILLLAGVAANRPSIPEYADTLPLLTPQRSFTELLTGVFSSVDDHKWHRQLALRIQQLMSRSGTVVSIVPTTCQPKDSQTLVKLADILSRREETVLVICPGTPGDSESDDSSRQLLHEVSHTFGQQVATLADYLHKSEIDIEALFHPAGNNISFVYSGSYDPELLFCRRMDEFLHQARQTWSIILLYGIELSETTSVEMLARHSDGLVLLHDSADVLNRDMQSTIDSLHELDAPLFGIATRLSEAEPSRIRFRWKHQTAKTSRSPGDVTIEPSNGGDKQTSKKEYTCSKVKQD